MPICPTCKEEHTKRQNGACPSCKSPMFIHDGEWIALSGGSPNMDFLRHFERLVSKQQSAQNGVAVVFQVGRRGMTYRMELVAAKQLIQRARDYLLDLNQDARRDLEIALAALDLLFSNSKFAWKTRSSLIGIQKDFQVALAIVIAMEKERLAREQRELETAQRAMQGENIFK